MKELKIESSWEKEQGTHAHHKTKRVCSVVESNKQATYNFIYLFFI